MEEVTKEAVVAVPNRDPVNEEADIAPNIPKLPVNNALPVTIKEPVIVWVPLNIFDPVIANTVLFNPSNRSELLAYDAVNIKEAVDAFNAKDALVEPLAYEALDILLDPNGPKMLEAVMNDAVCAVLTNDAVCANEALVEPLA